MPRLTLLLILILGGYALPLTGQKTNYSFTQLSLEQGLSQSTVKSILLDRAGSLWIGTQNGLNNYTQQRLRTFLHNPEDPYSLPDNQIYHIAEDPAGNIWVATPKGLACYDKESDRFTPISPLPFYSSLCMEEGMLFGGNNVMCRYDYKKQAFEEIYIGKESPETDESAYRMQKMAYLNDHEVLVGTKEKGIFRYDIRSGKASPFSQESRHLLVALYAASDNRVYASYYGDGLVCYNRTGEVVHHYTTRNSPLESNYILDIAEHNGSLWMATDGAGIHIMDLESLLFSHISHSPGDHSSLPVNSITVLYKDRDGHLWAGSVRGGIFTIKETYIKTYKDVVLNNTNGLSEKSVISLYEEENGRVWIGTDGGGINLYDPETDRFTHFPSTYGDKVASVTGVSDTELMVSLYTKGIFLFDKRTAAYRPFTIVNDSINYKECFYGYLPLVNRVSDDKIYILSYNAYIYHPKSKTFSQIDIDRVRDPYGTAFTPVYSNDLFVLLKCGNKAFIVDQQTDSIRLLFELSEEEIITSMSYDGDHSIWTGTNKGLGFFDLKQERFYTIRTKLFNSISFLTADTKGRLWICAQNMLFSYIINENRFTLWNTSDGFPPNEILLNHQQTPAGNFIYWGGTEGLVKINTEMLPTDTRIPRIHLSDILFNGSPYPGKVKNGKLKIPWNYHSLALRLRVENQDVFQKNMFRYTIAGRSDQETESYDPVLNLSSLSPGSYAIRVSCNTKNGDYIPPVQLITIRVTPPWYKTGWFIGIAILFLICLTVGTGYIYYRRKERLMKGSVKHFLQALLQTINDSPEPDMIVSKEDEAFIEKLNTLINEHLSDEELSIKFLTDHIGMSRASLYNKVKQIKGMGVNDYINRLRIEKSVYLLTHTNMSISEISYEVGFSYPRYFSTSFKQMKGMTPSQFKAENKKKEP